MFGAEKVLLGCTATTAKSKVKRMIKKKKKCVLGMSSMFSCVFLSHLILPAMGGFARQEFKRAEILRDAYHIRYLPKRRCFFYPQQKKIEGLKTTRNTYLSLSLAKAGEIEGHKSKLP
eukprot:gene7020-4978_t